MRTHTIRCPAGEVERFEPGSVVEFDPEACAHCPLRSDCTMASPSAGRTVSIAQDERLQHRLRKLIATPKGRERLRERVAVEHRLAPPRSQAGPSPPLLPAPRACSRRFGCGHEASRPKWSVSSLLLRRVGMLQPRRVPYGPRGTINRHVRFFQVAPPSDAPQAAVSGCDTPLQNSRQAQPRQSVQLIES
jgi:hypothetical protein